MNDLHNQGYLCLSAKLVTRILGGGSEKSYRVFRTFLGLKLLAPGHGAYFKKGSGIVQRVADLTNQSVRTVYDHLQKMQRYDWIGKDEDGTYYVRSFDYLYRLEDIKEPGRTYRMNLGYLLGDRKAFKAALFAFKTELSVDTGRLSMDLGMRIKERRTASKEIMSLAEKEKVVAKSLCLKKSLPTTACRSGGWHSTLTALLSGFIG